MGDLTLVATSVLRLICHATLESNKQRDGSGSETEILSSRLPLAGNGGVLVFRFAHKFQVMFSRGEALEPRSRLRHATNTAALHAFSLTMFELKHRSPRMRLQKRGREGTQSPKARGHAPVDLQQSCFRRLAEHHLSASAFLHLCLDAPVVLKFPLKNFTSHRRARCKGKEQKVPDGDGRYSLCGMFEKFILS